jgi:hypothetical protein
LSNQLNLQTEGDGAAHVAHQLESFRKRQGGIRISPPGQPGQ